MFSLFKKPDHENKKIINTLIGPAPWYWKSFPEIQSKSNSVYQWTMLGQDVALHLKGDPKNILLLLRTYSRPFVLSPGKIGVWYPSEGGIKCISYDLDNFKSLTPAELDYADKIPFPVFPDAKPYQEFFIPILEEGIHKFSSPSDFLNVNELLFIGDSSDKELLYSIYEWHPREGNIRVYPQRWFKKAEVDGGYEWITRVGRNPKTGWFLGDGIRISPFLLKENGCDLESLLKF